VAVWVNGRQFPSAWGKNKKDAEQEAARRALVELKLIAEEQNGD
jgi:dsRNA-specific ribonuclease